MECVQKGPIFFPRLGSSLGEQTLKWLTQWWVVCIYIKRICIFSSLRVFGLLSSSLLLFPQRFGRYILLQVFVELGNLHRTLNYVIQTTRICIYAKIIRIFVIHGFLYIYVLVKSVIHLYYIYPGIDSSLFPFSLLMLLLLYSCQGNDENMSLS